MSQGFLQAICERPHDLDVRLIFADWLDERHDPLGAFIRVQCELSSPGMLHLCQLAHALKCRCLLCTARHREHELLGRHIGSWTNGLPECLVTRECPSCIEQSPDWETNVIECGHCNCTGFIPCHDNIEFRNGFVYKVSCSQADWIAYGKEIVQAQPIEEVRLTDKFPEQHTHSGGVNYSWYLIGFQDDRATIVEMLFDGLLCGRPGLSAHRLAYDSEEEAQLALSHACVAWARSEAHLPALEMR